MTRYRLTGAVIVTARSTLHDVDADAPGLTGWLEAEVSETGPEVTGARLELPAGEITGKNALLTREIAKRLEPERFPLIHADITAVEPADDGRHPVRGELDLHGVRRPVAGSAIMRARPDGTLRVEGRVLLDIRGFGLRTPRLFGVRVRSQVDVRLRIVATPERD
jgi:polyisoprenoid-binding protein YceI